MRKNRAERRDVIADPIYNSKLVTRLINRVMLDGKKVQLKLSFTTHLASSLNAQAKSLWKCSKKQ